METKVNLQNIVYYGEIPRTQTNANPKKPRH